MDLRVWLAYGVVCLSCVRSESDVAETVPWGEARRFVRAGETSIFFMQTQGRAVDVEASDIDVAHAENVTPRRLRDADDRKLLNSPLAALPSPADSTPHSQSHGAAQFHATATGVGLSLGSGVNEVDIALSDVDVSGLDVDGVITVEAGATALCFCYLHDADGDPVQGDPTELAAWLIDPIDPANGLFRLNTRLPEDNAVGVYLIEITSTVASDYSFLVTYKAAPIGNDHVLVSVSPSSVVSIGKTLVEGSAIGTAIDGLDASQQIAGRNLSFIMTAADPYGNLQIDTRPGFELSSEIQDVADWIQVLEFGDGKTRFFFSIEKSGNYTLKATLGNATVYEADLLIAPDVPYPSNCRIYGMDTIAAGDLGTGLLEVQDVYGNLYDESYKDLIDLSQFHVGFLHERASPEDLLNAVQFTTFDGDRNATPFEYNLTRSGSYVTSALWEDLSPIQNDGAILTVLSSALRPLHSHVADSDSEIVAGEELIVRIVTRDRYDNIATEEERLAERTSIELSVVDERSVPETPASIVEVHPGMLEGILQPTAAGEFSFRIWIDDAQLPTGNDRVTVLPAAFDPSTSILATRKEVLLEEWGTVLLSPRDEYFNAITTPLNVSLQTEAANAEVRPFEPDGETGQLRGQFKSSERGNFPIEVVYGGLELWHVDVAVTDRLENGHRFLDDAGQDVEESLWYQTDVFAILLLAVASLLAFFIWWIATRDFTREDLSDATDVSSVEHVTQIWESCRG